MSDERSQEEQDYWDEHFRVHGHHPIPDLTGRHMCAHPMHEELAHLISTGGFQLEFPFDVREVFTLDDPAVMAHEARYDETVRNIKSHIHEIEERDRRNRSGKKEIF